MSTPSWTRIFTSLRFNSSLFVMFFPDIACSGIHCVRKITRNKKQRTIENQWKTSNACRNWTCPAVCQFWGLDVGMSGIAYAIMASAAVAIGLTMLLRFDAQAWMGKGLKRGDLYALIDVASGLRPDGLMRDQAQRLQARGMVRAHGPGAYRATLKGRLALFLR